MDVETETGNVEECEVDEDVAKEENELFYFESDHLALKGNKEYSEVLKTIVILESIRQRALKDYEEVVKLHKKAVEDPMSVITKLTNNESLGIPDLCQIPEVPKIDWKKFNIPVPEQAIKDLNEGGNLGAVKAEKRDLNPKDNRHWTTEEQKRLEELLVIYPPEDVELRRFKKIAAALGNRTVKQVCSRVQKYFQKLYKAGLPIPGRIPKNLYDKKKMHKHQRHNHYLWKPSTFFPELDIPVVMNDEEVPGPSSQSSQTSSSIETSTSTTNLLPTNDQQQNYLLPNNYNYNDNLEHEKSESDLQLEILKRVKYEKLKNSGDFLHHGFRCDFCGDDPISGSRWHCVKCVNDSVDFCNDCVVSQMFSNNPHPIKHKFVVIRSDKSSSTSISSCSEDMSDSDID